VLDAAAAASSSSAWGISRFSEEPKVENACHHGLVDPTMNFREAMDEINDIF
jgi:hypothetical protein